MRLGVLIPHHKDPRMTRFCMESISCQTLSPDYVCLVDDSEDGSAPIDDFERMPGVKRVIRSEARSCWGAKREGFSWLVDFCDFVICIDSDDYIPPNYFQKLMENMSDESVAVSYPSLLRFGTYSGYVNTKDWSPGSFVKENFCAATSLIRSSALCQIGGWPEMPNKQEFCDWQAWRLIEGLGWRFKRANVEYYWRMHGGSITSSVTRGLPWFRVVPKRELCTLAVPLCGRTQLWPRFADCIKKITRKFPWLNLMFYDNSSEGMKRWIFDEDFDCNVDYVRDMVNCSHRSSNRDVADDPARKMSKKITHRVAGCWNKIIRLARTPLLLCIEDDLFPAPDDIENLFLNMYLSSSVGVTAAYSDREGNPVCWTREKGGGYSPVRTQKRTGTSQICGSGFGCLLLDASEAKKVVANSSWWYDYSFWGQFPDGSLSVCWDSRPAHFKNGSDVFVSCKEVVEPTKASMAAKLMREMSARGETTNKLKREFYGVG